MSTVLVIGATGRVGRHVVNGLLAAGVSVRAFTRTATAADLPAEVELVTGDLHDVDAVRRAAVGVDAAFLLWPWFVADGAAEVVAELPRRVVYLSTLNGGGFWGEIEDLLKDHDRTFVRPSGFAVNTLNWAEQIRTTGVVQLPYPKAARSLIHERDIAAVAVLALLGAEHIGRTYEITGPEAITQEDQVATIAEVIGKPISVEGLTGDAARQQMLTQGADPVLADSAVTYWASLVDTPEPVTNTVAELTGRAAITFAEWAREHADAFRVPING
ncbi:NAD-dependent epimerase/dehydratase family protein [Kribbella antibiotica]|uniref:NAD-dependent epimerase/dehydratase family protein n=1 Tax=Kribbella antibiotica TaxID=190195 RepID=A0A4V2YP26_9ACTN|nr:NmrA family NAD(P)-binding protein [Kribbella antibiotica]TDD56337.1 NAD-dependent epimerase/dehydratase family protein [Kribbella antibiotica]